MLWFGLGHGVDYSAGFVRCRLAEDREESQRLASDGAVRAEAHSLAPLQKTQGKEKQAGTGRMEGKRDPC